MCCEQNAAASAGDTHTEASKKAQLYFICNGSPTDYFFASLIIDYYLVECLLSCCCLQNSPGECRLMGEWWLQRAIPVNTN